VRAILPLSASARLWLGCVAFGAAAVGCDGGEKIIYVEKEVPVESDGSGGEGTDTADPDGNTADLDGDGYGADDCNDNDPDINPGTVETCNGIDDDCDGVVDDVGAPPTWYLDDDGDGYGVSGANNFIGCDAPSGYALAAGDCDDTRADVFPGADPICEPGVDGDCDSVVDFTDADRDGFLSCDDCDDDNSAVHPDATEVCNGIDDDCDDNTDGADAVDATDYYPDRDNDGFGDDSAMVTECEAPSNHVLQGGDCDDTARDIHPDAAEECDEVDNDCDTLVDEPDAIDAPTFYADTDTDGYGDPDVSQVACEAPSGFVSNSMDCDDTDSTINPAGTEVCGGGDEDCDGIIDDADATVTGTTTFYEDADSDTYGNAASTTDACVAPTGFVSDATDCDDTDGDVHPAATEMCDSVDNNCDGTTDEDTAADARNWYLDADSDAYGLASSTTTACNWPVGYAAVRGDCDDTDASVNPGATESWYDGIDADCAGDSDYDADADGSDSDAYSGTDCDDTDATVYVGAPDTWYDGVDSDCAEDSDYDADLDGYDIDTHGGTDCDDTDATVYVGATDTWYDGIDSDCDGRSDYDADYDGFDSDAHSGDDCDDTDELVHPYAWEDDADGIDNDCDGATDSADLHVPIDLGLGDDDDGSVEISVSSGWSFPFCSGDYATFYLNGNGLLTFDAATTEFYESVTGITSTYAPAIGVFWDDFDLSDNTDSLVYGIVYTDAIGIYFRNAEEYYGTATNDFGIILFDDGRMMWDFGSMSVSDGMVGWGCGTGTGDAVDWSAERATGVEGLPTLGSGTEDAMYQQFSYSDPMDLGESTLWSCGTAGDDLDGDDWTDLCGDPDDSDASVTP